MRLIHKTTHTLHWFTTNPPPYIILSHRWLGAETSLQEFVRQASQPESAWSDGTRKVMRFCAEVASRSVEYVWVDTCCIDKTSSTELQEAINSMFQWYEQAALALVWLDDVVAPPGDDDDDAATAASAAAKQSFIETQMAQSLWFSRGWTLQELIAPKQLVFVDREWRRLGERDRFAATIQRITSIPAACLGNTWATRNVSVAERMSWLSRRRTTREEDLAYCMLGIFDVNMPMLYGEGKKAFLRLQRELIDVRDDESLFLWTRYDGIHRDLAGWVPPSSVLAPLPRCFESVLGKTVALDAWFDRAPLRVTAKGLMLEVWASRQSQFERTLKVPLNVRVDGRRAYLELRGFGAHTALHQAWFQPAKEELLAADQTEEEEELRRPPTEHELYDEHLRDSEREGMALRSKAFQESVAVTQPHGRIGDMGYLMPRHHAGVAGYTPRPEFGTGGYARFYREERVRFTVIVR